jgi:hypothetical protein
MRSAISLALPVVAIFIITTAAAQSASPALHDDACALLTDAQVSTALSVPVGTGSYQMPTFKKTCTWNSTGDAAKGAKSSVVLMLDGLDAYKAGKATRQSKTTSVTPLSGVGDDAYYLAVGSNVGLIVKKRNVAFKVAVYSTLPIEKKQAMEKALAQQIVSKL